MSYVSLWERVYLCVYCVVNVVDERGGGCKCVNEMCVLSRCCCEESVTLFVCLSERFWVGKCDTKGDLQRMKKKKKCKQIDSHNDCEKI